MLPTPDLSHLTRKDYEHVYEPAEDTFIMLDALELEADVLRAIKPRVCIEIGSGSGCVSSFLGKIVQDTCPVILATDINPIAANCTSRTGSQNNITIEPVRTSLIDAFLPRLRGSIDVLVFNPPYVPTEDEESETAQSTAGIAGSWAGGQYGMALTNVLLDQLKDLLSPNGRMYLVAIKQNDVPGIQRRLSEEYGLQSHIVLQRRAGGEYLFVVCFKHPLS